MQGPLKIRLSREQRVLDKEELEPIVSDFLVDGWAKQRYELGEVKVDAEKIDAKINITNFGTSKNDASSFYLSNTLVFPIVSNLTIIHFLTAVGVKKQFPVWLREYNIETIRRVRRNQGIHFRLQRRDCFESFTLEGERSTRPVINFQYSFDVDDGAFLGRIWGVFRATE